MDNLAGWKLGEFVGWTERRKRMRRIVKKKEREPLIKASPCDSCARQNCGNGCQSFEDWFSYSWSALQVAFGANPWNIRRADDIKADIAERRTKRRSDYGKPRGTRKKT